MRGIHAEFLIKMTLTIENYQVMNVSQKKKVKRDELQTLLEHLSDDVNAASIRGIIREELDAKFAELNKAITAK